MQLDDMSFVVAVRAVEVGGDLVDVIELADGRVIAVDGETITLFDDLEALLYPEDEDDEVERPSIPL